VFYNFCKENAAALRAGDQIAEQFGSLLILSHEEYGNMINFKVYNLSAKMFSERNYPKDSILPVYTYDSTKWS